MDQIYDLGGGWMWLVMDVLLVAILAAVIIYAYRSYRRRFNEPTAAERSRHLDAERHRLLREGR